MNLNIDPDWVRKMAEKEGNKVISVGGLLVGGKMDNVTGRKVTGYQIREAINRWSLRLQTSTRLFKDSIWKFEEEAKENPAVVVSQVSDAHDSISRLKEIQQFYNRQVKVDLPDETITLALAVQLLPGAGQVEKMWRDAATDTGRDRYSYRETSRDKDHEYAQRQISVQDAAKRAEDAARWASSLRNAISRGNTKEVAVGEVFQLSEQQFKKLFD